MANSSKKRFPESFAKIRQPWASQSTVLLQVKVKVMVNVKVKVKVRVKEQVNVMVMVIALGTQIRFIENLVKIRQSRASE